MSGDCERIELWNDPPVFEGEALKSEEKGQESRKVLEEIDSRRLYGSLSVVPPDPNYMI